MSRITLFAATILLDVLGVAAFAAVVLIILTGGGTVHIAGTAIRARSVANPLWILTGVVVLRYILRDQPFLGVRRWRTGDLADRGVEAVVAIPTSFRTSAATVGWLTIGIFAIRVLLAWRSPGFFSGDDVEVHEMTLGVLLHKPWSVWDLRCAFFPMVFVYPAQRLAFALGAASPEALVLSGRVAVALLSAFAIPLTWAAARQLSADRRLAAIAVLLLAVNKLQMSFGSSELPRPVSTIFVLAAFLFVLRGGVRQSLFAGVLLGLAIAFRFSEVVFLPAALVTMGRRSALRAVLLTVAACVTAATAIGLADLIYWGHAFHSVMAAVDYTLVRGESSRGYEPFWEYLRIVPSWTTWPVLALAVAGSVPLEAETWWLWIPVILLSLLPHKESRYLLPAIAFLCIAGARGYLRIAEWLPRVSAMNGWRRWGRDLCAPILAIAILHDIGGWRLGRSNEGVRLAAYLRHKATGGIGVQDPWRLGGQPYLSTMEPIVEMSPGLLRDRDALLAAVKDVAWVALRTRVARTEGDAVLHGLGFERDSWEGEDYVLYARAR